MALDATQPAPSCPQNAVPELDALLGIHSPTLPDSEDCLNLSVTVPEQPATKPRPVMVWIHGGSYVVGAGDSPLFDVTPLCTEQDVVVVAITYRLGLMGFLGGYAGRPANLGLLDIIEALRWIQANIAAFGGDPGNVTLFGESAGGDAIAHLMISEGTQGLFQRAIIQSAPLGLRHNRGTMMKAMGKVAGAVEAHTPVQELLRVQQKVVETGNRFGLNGGMPFSTQYGHFPLPPETETDAAWKRRAKEFDVLIGYNEEETALFLHGIPGLLKLSSLPLVGGLFRRALVSYTTGKVYGKPAAEFARRHAKGRGTAYKYLLGWGKERAFLGACHAVELALLFGGWETWKNARLIEGLAEYDLVRDGRAMRGLWGTFARHGQLEPAKGKLAGVLSWKKA